MNMVKNITIFTFLSIFFVIPMHTSAQTALDTKYQTGLTAGEYNNKGGSNDSAAKVIVKFISFLLSFLATIAVLVILVAGIMYITSGGDESKVESAKRWIMYAIIGLVIALFGWVIVNIVSNAIIT